MTDLDELERLLAEALPNPLKVYEAFPGAYEICAADNYATGGVCTIYYKRAEADALVALRNAAAELIADARRYREVRRGHRWSVKTCIGDALRAETLDAAVDAIAQERKP